MGTIKSGILGGFSGKVGGVVGTSWKGIAVMKAMPQSVANPRTNLQVAQRDNMSAMVVVAGYLLANYVRPLWDRFAQGMSGYNAFVSANIGNFIAGVFDTPELFKLSKGKMAATTPAPSTINVGEESITVTYTTDIEDSFQQLTDDMYCIAYNSTTGVWSRVAATVKRSAGNVLIDLPAPAVLGNVWHVYLSARRVDGTIVSETGYAAMTVVA